MTGLSISWWRMTDQELGKIREEVAREKVIRDGMKRTGEDRRTVIDFMDAHASMDQEAVLDLTEGEPTTLADALSRYVDGLVVRWPDDMDLDQETVTSDLNALLAYPWPGQKIAITAEMVDAYGAAWEAANGAENVINCFEHDMGDCPYHNPPGARRRAGLKAALISAGFQVD